MSWISLVLQILKALPKLITVAEQAFDGVPDSGADKKRMVKTAVHAIVSSILGVSSGGQDDTWKKIAGIIDPVIDIMCMFLFPKDREVK
jgi:hypothetical protein